MEEHDNEEAESLKDERGRGLKRGRWLKMNKGMRKWGKELKILKKKKKWDVFQEDPW